MKKYALAISALMLLLLFPSFSAAAVLYANNAEPSCGSPSFLTVQEAVNNATAGDKIVVCASSVDYAENVIVNKTLSIAGGQGNVRIKAANASLPAFTINADGSNLTNFEVFDAMGSAAVYVQGNANEASNVYVRDSSYGFYVAGSNNVFTQNNASAVGTGFYLLASSGNTLTSNTVQNANAGFLIHFNAHSNVLTSNTAKNATSYGFRVHDNAQNNTLTNNLAISGGGTGYALTTNANGNSLTGNKALNHSREGFVLDKSKNNVLTNNVVNQSGLRGFVLSESHGNTLAGNKAYYAGQVGFRLITSANNTLANNTAINTSYYGFYLQSGSDDNALTGNIATQHGQGIYIADSKDNNIVGDTYYGNRQEILIWTIGPQAVNFSRVVLDNPAGTSQNSTVLSFVDAVGPSAAYYLKWSGLPAALPPARTPFANKYVNVTNVIGNNTVESMTWHWTDAEVASGGYKENKFELWKYNGTWTVLNNTPDTVGNALGLAQVVLAKSVFAVLQKGN